MGRGSVGQGFEGRLGTLAASVASPLALLRAHVAPVLVLLHLALAAHFEHAQNRLPGAGVGRGPHPRPQTCTEGGQRGAQVIQERRARGAAVGPGDLDGDGAVQARAVPRREDALLPVAVPLGGRQQPHGRAAGLGDGVVPLRGDGEVAGCAQGLPERQPSVGGLNCMVGSGQPLPEFPCLGATEPSNGRGTVWLPEVTSHEYVPRTKQQRGAEFSLFPKKTGVLHAFFTA